MAAKNKRRQRSSPRQVAFNRFMLIVAVFVFWIFGIGARLVHLQVNQHAWLKEKATDQRQDIKKSKMLRGTIFDRDDHPLAMSVRVKSLYVNPTEIDDPDSAAKTLAKTLKLDAALLAKQIKETKEAGKHFVPLLKKVDEENVQRLNKVLYSAEVKKADAPQFAGLHWSEDQVRRYPHDSLASQVIGVSNNEDVGVAGIEQSQDELLHGAIAKKLQERDRLGRVYGETEYERAQPADIALTIGSNYQYQAELALQQGVQAANAKSGTAIVMSPKTGEILALANSQTFNPNVLREASPSGLTNAAIQSSYSPGSVFKLVTYGSALEKNLFQPDDQIDAGNGTIEVAKHKFTDSHHVGSVSYSQALAHSSNVCAIKTGMCVGKDDFYAMVQKMGFGRKTGIELPAETSGIVRAPEKWNGDSLASMSIGYEIGVTLMQIASAFATIANDGVRIQPRIIKEIRKAGEPPVRPAGPENTRVVSVETARNLRKMLRQVVLTGTGRRAQLNGYTSAGKTGTAWKFDAATKKINSSKYISSFIGFAPADNPEIVIAVVIDEPKAGARDGGMVAAPIFKAIAEQILPELNVKPDGNFLKDSTVAKDIPETSGGHKSAERPPQVAKTDKKAVSNDRKPVAGPKPGKDNKKTGDKKNAIIRQRLRNTAVRLAKATASPPESPDT